MSTFPFKKAAFAAAAVATLLITGCSAPSAEPASSSTPTSASATASATPTATETAAAGVDTPVSTDDATPYMAGAAVGSYQDRLAVGSSVIKAGEKLHVYGGTLEPGSIVKVYGAQQMAPPSYDAANKMYVQVGEEVKLTDQVSATVGPKGTYDIELLIPAGTAPQLVNIVMLSADGRGDLVQTTVQ